MPCSQPLNACSVALDYLNIIVLLSFEVQSDVATASR
jgi:hypothetical protein